MTQDKSEGGVDTAHGLRAHELMRENPWSSEREKYARGWLADAGKSEDEIERAINQWKNRSQG